VSRETAEPPSGTLAAFAEKLKNVCLPKAFWDVKAHAPSVGSNPLPLRMPVPVILRKVDVCVTTVELRRLNVNPPTLQRPGVGVEGLNIHEVAIVALVPNAMLEKFPLTSATLEKPRFPLTSRHFTTRVALARDFESNCVAPAKSIFPFIFAAWASCVERALVTRPAASTANIVFVRFFICSGVEFFFASSKGSGG